MRKVQIVIFILIILLSMAACSSDTEPKSTLSGKIVFQGITPDGAIDVYTVDADGKNLVALTTGDSIDGCPTWSPDGTRIAFESNRDSADDKPDIYVMDANGSNVVRLTDHAAHDSAPAWSPDGTRIAFVSGREGDLRDIFTMNADGTGVTRVTDEVGNVDNPDWSPDGEWIVFESWYGTGFVYNYQIFKIKPDGSNLKQLTREGGDHRRPKWSPDGKDIMYVVDFAGSWDIATMWDTGATQKKLTDTHNASEDSPFWSPDGAQIVYARGHTFYGMKPDGTKVHELFEVEGLSIVCPSWHP